MVFLDNHVCKATVVDLEINPSGLQMKIGFSGHQSDHKTKSEE